MDKNHAPEKNLEKWFKHKSEQYPLSSRSFSNAVLPGIPLIFWLGILRFCRADDFFVVYELEILPFYLQGKGSFFHAEGDSDELV